MSDIISRASKGTSRQISATGDGVNAVVASETEPTRALSLLAVKKVSADLCDMEERYM
jgi:hypothetical protein